MSSKPIESYGLIGDCETGALVGKDGSIDWLCWPRFDSASVFAALLGTRDNGRWRIGLPDGAEARSRQYRRDTLILETHLVAGDAEAVLIDFMAVGEPHSHLVRIVKGVRGRLQLEMDLVIRFGYGHDLPWLRRIDGEGEGETALTAIAGPDMVVLRTPVPTHGENMHTCASFEIGEGETLPFVLSYGPSYRELPAALDAEQALARTEAFWCDWCSRHPHPDGEEADDAVRRSLITLKALTYAPSGGIVAAATTSLPEGLGGQRNWDYRYCWIRDATISLLALMNGGYYDEAAAWRDWLLRAAAGDPDQLQFLYGITGERRLSEWSAPWLAGYENSRPVRIGNAAHSQLQLDVFGELMDALHQGRKGGLPEHEAAWGLQCALIAHLELIWREPDEGIWEVRGGPQHFTHSKVMAWVAFDRCIRSIEAFGMQGPLDRWRRVRDEIHRDVCANGYDEQRGAFVQAYGSKALDASMLLLPTLGFIKAEDPRFTSTVAAIEGELMAHGLVRRYDTGKTDDGLGGGEGVFLACSFWLADAYWMLGRREDARALFGRLLALRNDLGLMAEEYEPALGRQLGNFPQAYSHVALVNTATRLRRAPHEEERSPKAAPDPTA